MAVGVVVAVEVDLMPLPLVVDPDWVEPAVRGQLRLEDPMGWDEVINFLTRNHKINTNKIHKKPKCKV